MQNFIEELNETQDSMFEATLTTALSNINANLVWNENNLETIAGWLDDYKKSSDTTESSTTDISVTTQGSTSTDGSTTSAESSTNSISASESTTSTAADTTATDVSTTTSATTTNTAVTTTIQSSTSTTTDPDDSGARANLQEILFLLLCFSILSLICF